MEFMFDIETCGIESNAVVLSAAIIPFTFDEVVDDPTAFYQHLLTRAMYVKFETDSQRAHGRVVTRSTIDWWALQAADVRKRAFGHDGQVHPADGIKQLRDFVIDKAAVKTYTMWGRGGLDQVVFDSLCRSYGQEPLADYWCWYDVRTFLALTKTTAQRGYVTVPGFDHRAHVVKHDPIHDCANDVLQMLAGE